MFPVKVWYIFLMISKILQQDHNDLIRLNQSLSPEERLVAFYHHSKLLSQLSLVRKVEKKQDIDSSAHHLPPAEP